MLEGITANRLSCAELIKFIFIMVFFTYSTVFSKADFLFII